MESDFETFSRMKQLHSARTSKMIDFEAKLAHFASDQCEVLCTYLLSAQVFLEGGVSFFMDSNRFFMVGVTFIRLL